MVIKDLIPVGAVALGWLLSEMSSRVKNTVSNKQALARSITALIHLYDDATLHARANDGLKDIFGIGVTYEDQRRRSSERHFMDSDSHIKLIDEAIDALRPLYPIEAIELQEIRRFFERYKKVDLTQTSNDRDAYVRAISILEVSFDAFTNDLYKMIIKLALRHSMVSWLYVRRRFSKRTKNVRDTAQFVNKMVSELHGDYARAKQATEKTNPEVAK